MYKCDKYLNRKLWTWLKEWISGFCSSLFFFFLGTVVQEVMWHHWPFLVATMHMNTWFLKCTWNSGSQTRSGASHVVIYDGVLVCLHLLPVASATVYFHLRLLQSIQYKLIQTKGKHHRQNLDILMLSFVPRNYIEMIYEQNILFRHDAKRDFGKKDNHQVRRASAF